MGKMMKRVVAVALALVMMISLVPANVASAASKINNKVIYIYSFNEELKDKLNFFYDKYPQYKKLVKFVQLEGWGEEVSYVDLIDQKLKGKSKVPSIVCFDGDWLPDAISSKNYVSLDTIGFKDSYYKNAYEYTKQMGTYKGKLKAVSWQACPGGFVYNRQIAKKVLGTDNPTKVQAYVKNWKQFEKTAKKLKSSGYSMVYCPWDLARPLQSNPNTKWIKSNKVQTTTTLKNMINTEISFVKNGYFQNPNGFMWDEGWNSSFNASESKVFGFFGCTWSSFLFGEKAEYNICEGPSDYYWGGSYMMVTNKCPNPALAALVLKTMCGDTATMTKLSQETGDFPNNKAAVKRVIKAGVDIPAYKVQNAFKVWDKVASGINMKNTVSCQIGLWESVVDSIYEAQDAKKLTYNNVLKIYKRNVKERFGYK